jgi:photosystem II stability/assembly factor-like uncharacterized protein
MCALLQKLGLAFLLSSCPAPAVAHPVEVPALAALQPRNIGPAGMSGRIADIAVQGSDPSVIWVGAATGGVWKSTNGGTTFTPVFDGQRVSGIGALAIGPGDPDVVWVGTGEGNPRNSAGVGDGLYRTRDGGRTWERVGLEGSERIHRILVHPQDPDVVWVGVLGPAWSDGEVRGVFKTTDGGATWRRVLWENPRTGASDLVMDPSNPMKLFAGMWEFRREPWFFTSGGPGSGLHVSHDGGETWHRSGVEHGMPPGELGRIGLAVSPADPRVIYALVEASRSALLRSSDGGATWRTVNDDAGIANRPFYYADVFVDPADPDRVYNLAARLTVSEDGGRTFRPVVADVHPDSHALWINPSDPRHLLLGSDGGVWESRDHARTWRFFENLPVGQFYHVSVDDAVPYNVYGGMQDNGSWRGPSAVWEAGGIRSFHWKEIGFGDGFNALVDPREPHFGYAMSQGGNLHRFDVRNGERKSIRPWAPDGVRLRFNWNAAIALDPFDPATVYFGSQFVHQSHDRGHSWQVISPDLTTNDPAKQRQAEGGGLSRESTGAENHTTLLAIAPSPVEREVLWTGSDDGKVQLSRAGGGTWEDLTTRIRGVPPGTWIPHVEASKHAPGTAYVVFDDHRRGRWDSYLFRTENHGRDWRNLAQRSGIDGFLHTVEEDPVAPELLFAGGELGLFVSLNRGASWFKWTHGFPTVPVRSLVVHPRDHDLVIGTHGRGVWILDDVRPLRALARTPSIAVEPVHLFDPPVAYLRTAAATDGHHFSGDAVFRGESRAAGAVLTYWVGVEDADTARVTIVDGVGRAIRSFPAPAVPGLNRITWDLREEIPRPGSDAAPGEALDEHGPLLLSQILPGAYAARVTVVGITVERPLSVLADPRVEVPLAERIEKIAALRHAVGLTAILGEVEARQRVVEDGLSRVRVALAARSDEAAMALRAEADSLQARLAGAADARDAAVFRRAVATLGSSWDRPTEGQRLDLHRMDDALRRVVDRLNGFIEGEWGPFRGRVEAGGLTPLPDPGVVPPVPARP